MSREEIGNVILDTDDYSGREPVWGSAGTEDFLFGGRLLETAKNVPEAEYGQAILREKSWPLMREFSPLRGNLLSWYPFRGTDRVLEVGSGCGALTGTVADRVREVVCVEPSQKKSLVNAWRNRNRNGIRILCGTFLKIEKRLEGNFDVIVLTDTLSYAAYYMDKNLPNDDADAKRPDGHPDATPRDGKAGGKTGKNLNDRRKDHPGESFRTGEEDVFRQFLMILKKHMSPDGVLLCAVPNRLGMKYLAGTREDHTGTFFSGVEGYESDEKIRTFTKPALTDLFLACGFERTEFYYPYPDYRFPTAIYSDRRLPLKGELRNNLENFESDRMLLFDETAAFDAVLSDGLFPLFANSYLVEARVRNRK